MFIIKQKEIISLEFSFFMNLEIQINIYDFFLFF